MITTALAIFGAYCLSLLVVESVCRAVARRKVRARSWRPCDKDGLILWMEGDEVLVDLHGLYGPPKSVHDFRRSELRPVDGGKKDGK